MHVRIGTLLAVLVALAAPAAHASATAGVRMLTCEPGTTETGGVVVYRARMSAVPGTAQMALRIRLFERYGDGEFERVDTQELGIWRRSRSGASGFRYTQRVEGLHQGAVYRAIVQYRWLDAEGELIKATRRRSETCSQGGELPNLRVAAIDVDRGEVEDTAVYKVKIVNGGAAIARAVGVLLRIDGEIVDEEVIDALDPKETRTVTFNGPVCRRHMRVIVDPRDLISESREQDNELGPPCV